MGLYSEISVKTKSADVTDFAGFYSTLAFKCTAIESQITGW